MIDPLSVSDLEVSCGTIPAVRGVSLDVGAADRVALLGRNGAGKTSTLRAIAGITPAKGGRIEYAGVEHHTAAHQGAAGPRLGPCA